MKSTDPRKPSLVAAVKAATGATKLTNFKETRAGFRCDCLAPIPPAERRNPNRMEFRRIGVASAVGDGSPAYPWRIAFLRAPVRFCVYCPGEGSHKMSCTAYKGGRVAHDEPCRQQISHR